MNNWTKEHRIELNARARKVIELLMEQNPDKVYWTSRELFGELRKEGFNSQRDMALSLSALGVIQRTIKVDGRASRCYLLKGKLLSGVELRTLCIDDKTCKTYALEMPEKEGLL